MDEYVYFSNMYEKEVSSPVFKPMSSNSTKHPETPGPMQLDESYHPSPNRTEAAAAMMNLLSASATSPEPAIKSESSSSTLTNIDQNEQEDKKVVVKQKRKYVRKATKKNSTSEDQMYERRSSTSKTSSVSNGSADSSSRSRSSSSSSKRFLLHSSENSETSPEWKPLDDSVVYAPFREYNRKEKSLGLLCENFLNLYRNNLQHEICLDRAALELGVERRRIYDIVNILESIHLVSRKSKNLYNWHGLEALPLSMNAMKQKYLEVLQKETRVLVSASDGAGAGAGGAGGGANHNTSPTPTPTAAVACSYDYNFKDRRRGKSLSKLSQMFVQLFLRKEHCIIPLDEAAKQLIQMEDSENEEDRLLKTKIRRLYDVANVLVSVGLIEKLQLSTSRKPVFRWKHVDDSSVNTAVTPIDMMSISNRTSCSQDTEGISDNVIDDEDDLGMMSTQDTSIRTSQSSIDGLSDPEEHPQEEEEEDKEDKPTPDCTIEQQQQSSKKRKGSCSSSELMEHFSPTQKKSKTNKEEETTSSPNIPRSPSKVLRFDQQMVPLHPQIIMEEQQEQLKSYMQQYIREYVDFVILQQVQQQTQQQVESSSSSSSSLSVDMIHRTPVSVPSLTNRVTAELAGSIQDLLFANTTSPQSVTDFFSYDSHRITKSSSPSKDQQVVDASAETSGSGAAANQSSLKLAAAASASALQASYLSLLHPPPQL